MKRNIILSIFCLLSGFTCMAQNSFTLSGKFFTASQGDTIYLKQPIDRESSKLLLKIPVHGDSFTISGKQDSTLVAFLEYTVGNVVNRKSFLLQSGNIHFIINNESASVSGTEANDSLQSIVEHREQLSLAWDKADDAYESAAPNDKERIKQEVRKWGNATQDYTVSAIRRNIDNPLGILLLFEYTKFTPAPQLAALIESIPDKYKNNPYVLQQREFIHGIEQTKEGQHFVDFQLPTADGKLIKISDIIKKNKYTVIDFWASWCVPCCREMPELIKLYNKYKSQGLGVVGISWDRDKNSWIAGIRRLNIPWTQLSDIKGRENVVGKLYGVRTIPSIWIINQQGIIIAKCLRGDDVPNTINGLFK
jgi:peroxiredoxin